MLVSRSPQTSNEFFAVGQRSEDGHAACDEGEVTLGQCRGAQGQRPSFRRGLVEQNHERDDAKWHYLQEAVDVLFELADVTIALEGDSNIEHRSRFVGCCRTRHERDKQRIHLKSSRKQQGNTRFGKHRRVDKGFLRATVAGFFDMRASMASTSPSDRGRAMPGARRTRKMNGLGA